MFGDESQAKITDDADAARAFTGALFLAELTHDVRQIKRLLTPAK